LKKHKHQSISPNRFKTASNIDHLLINVARCLALIGIRHQMKTSSLKWQIGIDTTAAMVQW
jgi:hypothetical protein